MNDAPEMQNGTGHMVFGTVLFNDLVSYESVQK